MLVQKNDTIRFYIASLIYNSGGYFHPDCVTVTENMGAEDNYIIPYHSCYIDDDGFNLRCYKDDQFSLYQIDSTLACDYIYVISGLIDNRKATYDINISPNPITHHLQIKNENAQMNDAELIITDPLGRTIARDKLRTELTNFNTQDWAKGMYVWSLVEDGLVVKSGKVVKE